MITLGQRYISEGNTVSVITFHDEGFTLETPTYKRGKATFIEYTSVKGVSISGSILIIKILRTEVEIEGFDSTFVRDAVLMMKIGASGKISKSNDYRKYVKQKEKAAKRHERVERIADTISGVRTGFSRGIEKALSDGTAAIVNQCRQLEESEEEKAKQKIEKSIKENTININDDESVSVEKIQKLFQTYRNSKNNDDLDDDIANDILETIKESLCLLKSRFPDSQSVKIYQSQYDNIIKKKRAADKKEMIYTIVAITLLSLYAIFYYRQHIIDFLKNLL